MYPFFFTDFYSYSRLYTKIQGFGTRIHKYGGKWCLSPWVWVSSLSIVFSSYSGKWTLEVGFLIYSLMSILQTRQTHARTICTTSIQCLLKGMGHGCLPSFWSSLLLFPRYILSGYRTKTCNYWTFLEWTLENITLHCWFKFLNRIKFLHGKLLFNDICSFH